MADTFLKKIVQMLNPENEELIKWNKSGDSIIIVDPNRFSRDLLPKYFKTKKFNSFVRQLNFYGFKKVPLSKTTKGCEFYHKLFKRGSEDKVINIKRKIIHEMEFEELDNSVNEQPIEQPQEEQLDEKDKLIKQLTERCNELEKENEQLKLFNATFCHNECEEITPNVNDNYAIQESSFLNNTFRDFQLDDYDQSLF